MLQQNGKLGLLSVVMLAVAGCGADSDSAAQSAKTRTLEAWQSLQAVDGNSGSMPNLENFADDPRKILPAIGFLRRVATGYTQIDLTNVDPAFADHIENSISAHVKLANVLEGIHGDLMALGEKLQNDVNSARRIGNFIGGEESREAGADLMEFVVRMGMDEDVKKAKEKIIAAHMSSLVAAIEEFGETAERDGTLAEELSAKYDTRFIDAF